MTLMKVGLGLAILAGICKFSMLRSRMDLTRGSKPIITISDNCVRASLSVSLLLYCPGGWNVSRPYAGKSGSASSVEGTYIQLMMLCSLPIGLWRRLKNAFLTFECDDSDVVD